MEVGILLGERPQKRGTLIVPSFDRFPNPILGPNLNQGFVGK